MSIIKSVKNIFGTRSISLSKEEVPEWVRKAQERWETKLGCNPYDRVNKFYGKTWIYECKFTTIEQGKCSERWVKYLKN